VKGWGKVSERKLWRNSLGGAEGSFAPLSPSLRLINVEIEDTKYLIARAEDGL
jgi:hypothetical protein